MIDQGLFYNSNKFHIELIRYCFTNLFQKKLDENTRLWNAHNIHKTNKSEGPFGKPEIIYEIPEICNSEQKGIEIDEENINPYKEMHAIEPSPVGCSEVVLKNSRK